MVKSFIEELRTVVSAINGEIEVVCGEGGGIPVSAAVVVALYALDLIPKGADIMMPSSDCVCDDGDEEGHSCWDEIPCEVFEGIDSISYDDLEIWL